MSTTETKQPRSSTVYTPGKDQEFVWGIVDKVVDGTRAVTQPIGSVVSTGASAVTNTVGGAVSAVGHVGDNFQSSPVNSTLRGKIAKLSKDHVSDWLSYNGLHSYRLGFQSNEVDGHSLLALLELWKADKSGFLKFAQESLGVKAPGHALRLASVLEDLHSYKFEESEIKLGC